VLLVCLNEWQRDMSRGKQTPKPVKINKIPKGKKIIEKKNVFFCLIGKKKSKNRFSFKN